MSHRRPPAPALVTAALALTAAAPALHAQTPASPGAHPLVPDTVLAPAGAPTILVLRAPGARTVTLRASVRLTEGPTEGGAARLMSRLGVARARGLGGPVTARIEGDRTPTGIAYSVTGSVRDFDYLAYLLRQALAEPRPGRVDFQRAQHALLEELRRSSETPSRRVARGLRERAFAGATPIDGTLGSVEGLTPATLRGVWRRSHSASAIDLIVVGDVPRELLLTSVQGMGAAGDGSAAPPTATAPTVRGGDPQVLRRWYGEARAIPDADDPRGAVAALLVAGHVRDVTSDFEAHVELWQLGNRQVLAVMGAAYSSNASAMRSRVRDAVRATGQGLDPSRLEAAVARVRKEALFEARTPWGRADVVGRRVANGGRVDAARRWMDALDAITPEAMRSYLADLAAITPVRTDVTP